MPATALLSIGQLAARTGLSVSAIRFYETRGLVAPIRNAGGQRRFARRIGQAVDVPVLPATRTFLEHRCAGGGEVAGKSVVSFRRIRVARFADGRVPAVVQFRPDVGGVLEFHACSSTRSL